MVTISVDPHKQTHTAVATDALGVQVAQRTVAAGREGFGELVSYTQKLCMGLRRKAAYLPGC